jgi:superfamily II DNA/RNA helicase
MAPTFADLGVPDSICAALRAAGITSPFPVQAATIPDLLAGRDVVGRAPTGSGKTLAFGVPLVCMVPKAEPKMPSALVLAPTRELAAQIATELQPILAAADRRALAVYGGVGLDPQIKKLRRGVDVLVATPGRLEDLISQRVVSLENVSMVVVDEADRMADMGFLPVVRRLLNQTRNDRQTILYSATLDGDVGKVIREYQNNPVRHEVGAATPDLTTMTHLFWKIPRPERIPLCASVIQTFGRTIVFSRTRHGADRATRQLAKATGPRVSASERSLISGVAKSRHLSPPTSPPAAFTSTPLSVCCTSTRLMKTAPTCTAQDERLAPVPADTSSLLWTLARWPTSRK